MQGAPIFPLGGPLDVLVDALRRQQTKALEGHLNALLQQLGGPRSVLVALGGIRSQKDIYLLLLALIKVRL